MGWPYFRGSQGTTIGDWSLQRIFSIILVKYWKFFGGYSLHWVKVWNLIKKTHPATMHVPCNPGYVKTAGTSLSWQGQQRIRRADTVHLRLLYGTLLVTHGAVEQAEEPGHGGCAGDGQVGSFCDDFISSWICRYYRYCTRVHYKDEDDKSIALQCHHCCVTSTQYPLALSLTGGLTQLHIRFMNLLLLS